MLFEKHEKSMRRKKFIGFLARYGFIKTSVTLEQLAERKAEIDAIFDCQEVNNASGIAGDCLGCCNTSCSKTFFPE